MDICIFAVTSCATCSVTRCKDRLYSHADQIKMRLFSHIV
nr:MAG TPA: hypothetical protein [Caudoviricetes sp.]